MRNDNKNVICSLGWTPLHLAAKHGNIEVCRLLLAQVEVTMPNRQFGFTPLHYAAKEGHLEVNILFSQMLFWEQQALEGFS